MVQLQAICEFLEAFAPRRLAEEWDNVGLLVGDPEAEVRRVMTCLTITQDTVAEAVGRKADVIVAHHPLPFRPLKRITVGDAPGRLLLQLIRAGIAVYSPHTSFDSASGGINQQLAIGLGLSQTAPLEPIADDPQQLGAGRYGELSAAADLDAFADIVKRFLGLSGLHIVGAPERSIRRVAVACGSAGQFLGAAKKLGCDCLVTGETSFHTCLEAQAVGVALVLPGHYASERFAVESLAKVLADGLRPLEVWASVDECDPLRWR